MQDDIDIQGLIDEYEIEIADLCYVPSKSHIYVRTVELLEELKNHAARSGWVAIEDIPEEWKNGRWVWLARFSKDKYNGIIKRTKWHKNNEQHNWQYHFNAQYWPATHAMLPPPPPQLKGGE